MVRAMSFLGTALLDVGFLIRLSAKLEAHYFAIRSKGS